MAPLFHSFTYPHRVSGDFLIEIGFHRVKRASPAAAYLGEAAEKTGRGLQTKKNGYSDDKCQSFSSYSVAWINFNEAMGKTFQGGLFYEKAGCGTFNRCGAAERVQ